MKLHAFLALAVLAGPVAAAPVHIALKTTAAVSPNADGFFTLGAVAEVTGGGNALRARLAGIPIGRAPLSGETRRLTRGDLALKLRQAGCDPEKSAVLEGADAAEVTTEEPTPPQAATLPKQEGEEVKTREDISPRPPAPGGPLRSDLSRSKEVGSLIHRGDALTIVIQTGLLTITAPGVARENGGAGQMIRVHREGVMTDLAVQVLDAQTVQLEI
jgi:hypothetical protein